jgi:hypothetical protein
MIKLINLLKELVTATEIICDNCGWRWKIVDGGDDLYICHKCGHDNTPKNLEEKMIKLVDILKEIQIQPKKRIGYGDQGNVYNVGKNKVVKKSTNLEGFSQDEIEIYNLFNQHPDIFPHIYKLTKDYVIMDKIDSPGKELMNVYDFLDDVDPSPENKWKSMPWREEDFLQNIYKSLYDNNLETFNQILQKAKESNRMDVYNTLKKCLDFCIKLKELFQNKRIDVHLGNVGIGNDGKIKIFDASFDRMG